VFQSTQRFHQSAVLSWFHIPPAKPPYFPCLGTRVAAQTTIFPLFGARATQLEHSHIASLSALHSLQPSTMEDDTPVVTASFVNVSPPPHNQWKVAMQKIVSAHLSRSQLTAAHTLSRRLLDGGDEGTRATHHPAVSRQPPCNSLHATHRKHTTQHTPPQEAHKATITGSPTANDSASITRDDINNYMYKSLFFTRPTDGH